MAVPKRKQTPSRTGMRRAQTMKYSTKNIVEDKKSGEYRLAGQLLVWQQQRETAAQLIC